MHALLIALLAGCVARSRGTGALEAYAHDTQLDRVRVLAIRVTPDVPMLGAPFTIDTLAFSPSESASIVVDGCAWDAERPVQDLACFGVPELISTLGTGASIAVTRSAFLAFPSDDCAVEPEDTMIDTAARSRDCIAPLQLRVTATSAGQRDVAAVSVASISAGALPVDGTPSGELTLTTHVDGAEVVVDASVLLPDGWQLYGNDMIVARWYSTDGIFLGSGRTTGVVAESLWRTTNRLAVDKAAEVIVVVVVERGVWTPEAHYGVPSRADVRWARVRVETP